MKNSGAILAVNAYVQEYSTLCPKRGTVPGTLCLGRLVSHLATRSDLAMHPNRTRMEKVENTSENTRDDTL